MAKDKDQVEAVEELAAELAKESTGLIPVTKDGETIEVCPEQVEQHQRLGWQLAE